MARVCRVINARDAQFPVDGYQWKAGDTACYLIQDDSHLVTVNRGIRVETKYPCTRFVRHPSGKGALEITYHTTDPEYFEHEGAETDKLTYERLPDIPGTAQEVAEQFRHLFDHLPRSEAAPSDRQQ